MWALVLLCRITSAGGVYILNDSYVAADFFSRWSFWRSMGTKQHGFVQYVDREIAMSTGLARASAARVYIGADARRQVGAEGRRSIRLQSKMAYNTGLFILRIEHIPTGCGTRPVFRMFGGNGTHPEPGWGKFDVISGVHKATRTLSALRTNCRCDQHNTTPGKDFTGQWTRNSSGEVRNCAVSANDDTTGGACYQLGDADSMGPAFNEGGGGTYAVELDPTRGWLKAWFWPGSALPEDIAMRRPDPATWGAPYSGFRIASSSCSLNDFNNMHLEFDLSFCGEVGPNDIPSGCPELRDATSCQTFVAGNPQNMTGAFWSLSALDVYQHGEVYQAGEVDTSSQSMTGMSFAALPGSNPVITLDLYRAMNSAHFNHKLEATDVADLGGALKYVHTEILAEHQQNPSRGERKYGVDCIARWRFKIRNPADLLTTTVVPDFGDFIAYDFGTMSEPSQVPTVQTFGDFVGIQQGCTDGKCDVRYPVDTNYFWFSLGNRCPNLRWEWKGTAQAPNASCLRRTTVDDFLRGGLCPGASGDDAPRIPEIEPAGQSGCVYTYGASQHVMLDAVVGIANEDCGGHMCNSFAEFRQNCTNTSLQRQYQRDGQVKHVDYCVEYDIHPACEGGCALPECKGLIDSEQVVELGLPFWQGRCSTVANQRRLETLAAAFGIPGARTKHQTVDEALLRLELPCVYPGERWCSPDVAGSGGPYCSRSLSGVCERCYIPGTKLGPEPASQSFCPFDVLKAVDYRDIAKVSPPECKSTQPRDLCCLYTGTCAGSDAGPSLDDDGLALVESRGDTTGMAAFLAAVQEKDLDITWDPKEFQEVAYYQWGQRPSGRTLEQVLAEVHLELKHYQQMPSKDATMATAPPLTTPVATNDKAASAGQSVTTATPSSSSATGASGMGSAEAAEPMATTTTTEIVPTSTTRLSSTTHTTSTTKTTSRTYTTSTTNTTSTTSTTSATSTTSSTTSTAVPSCFMRGRSFAPLNMRGSQGSTEADPTACQERCAITAGCMHFSFMEGNRSCHLHDIYADIVDGKEECGSAPFRCWEDMLAEDRACFEEETTYVPSNGSEFYVSPSSVRLPASIYSGNQSVIACQRLCSLSPGCLRFTMDFSVGLCSLARSIEGLQRRSSSSSTAGPPRCGHGGPNELDLHELGTAALQTLASSAGLLAVVVSVLGGLVAVALGAAVGGIWRFLRRPRKSHSYSAALTREPLFVR